MFYLSDSSKEGLLWAMKTFGVGYTSMKGGAILFLWTVSVEMLGKDIGVTLAKQEA